MKLHYKTIDGHFSEESILVYFQDKYGNKWAKGQNVNDVLSFSYHHILPSDCSGVPTNGICRVVSLHLSLVPTALHCGSPDINLIFIL